MARRTLFTAALLLATTTVYQLQAQVTSDRLLKASAETQNWLTYNGNYTGSRYSLLDQINAKNVTNLEQKWVFQANVIGAWQTTPLVVDGIMYMTQRFNDVIALDAKTG